MRDAQRYRGIIARIFLLVVACMFIAATRSLAAITYPIVDTGQTNCYGSGSAVITAPAPGQAFYGQDGQSVGNQPAYTNNGDGTISDQVTGLMWVKARGSKVTWDAAVAGAAACQLGGHADWRMPTIKELYSLINYTGKSGVTDAQCIPYINTNYFDIVFGDVTGGRVIDGQDWSATQYTGTTMQGDATVFGVNFIDGRIKGYPKYQPGSNGTVGNTLYVRYVRGNPNYGTNSLVNNLNGTITDQATGLMWSQTDSGTGMNWQAALAWAQTKNAANYLGHNDWRLPNAKELQSIVDYTRSLDATNSAAINPLFTCTAIKDEGNVTDYPFYWSSTTHLDNMGAVYVTFGEALGYMQFNAPATNYTLADVHGAGAQRSDPKSGYVTDYPLGVDGNGNTVYGRGPQGDVIRINNYVRLVRNAAATLTPTFTPAAGSYAGTVTVALACATPGAIIHYTLDGSTPTAASPLYTSAITLTNTATIQAVASSANLLDSAVASAAYIVTSLPQVATPTFSPAGGSYVGSVAVTLASITTGAAIHYTLDGTTPTAASPLYNSAITLTGTTTIKAIATETGMTDSAVALAAYTITALPQVATPTFSPAAGTYAGSVTVILACATTGAVIHYTLDGSTPTAASPLYSTALTLTSATTVKALASKTTMTDSAAATATYLIIALPHVATPTISPAAGVYAGSVTVTLGCTTPGAAIYYTLDGTVPTAASPHYTTAITLTSTATVAAIATNTGMTDSTMATADYVIIPLPQVAMPTFSPATGSYAGSVVVTLNCATSGAEIHYTLDGSTPTSASPLFTVPFIVSGATTVNAIAIMSGMADSPIASAIYTIAVATPAFTPAPGSFTGPVTMSLACATSSAVIYYTLDGSTPTATSWKYSGPLLISASATVKAVAIKAGLADSAVAIGSYVIAQTRVAAPMLTPAPGSSRFNVTVACACATAGATIRYALNGAALTANSPVYTLPLNFTASTTIMAQAFKAGLSASLVTTGAYTITGDKYEPDDTPAQAKVIANGMPQSRFLDVIGDVDWVKFTLTEKSEARIETFGPSGDTEMWLYGPYSATSQVAYNDNNGASKFSLITRTGANALAPGTYYIKVGQHANSGIVPAYTLLLNTNGATQVATPTITPHGGAFKTKVVVTLATATAGAAIYYTTDGSDPTPGSPLYTGPLTLTASKTLKAAAFRSGYLANTMAVEGYVITP